MTCLTARIDSPKLQFLIVLQKGPSQSLYLGSFLISSTPNDGSLGAIILFSLKYNRGDAVFDKLNFKHLMLVLNLKSEPQNTELQFAISGYPLLLSSPVVVIVFVFVYSFSGVSQVKPRHNPGDHLRLPVWLWALPDAWMEQSTNRRR